MKKIIKTVSGPTKKDNKQTKKASDNLNNSYRKLSMPIIMILKASDMLRTFVCHSILERIRKPKASTNQELVAGFA